MKRRDPFDEIHISGQVYSIKKIKKLYELNNAVYPNMLDTAENMWICPKCGEFHRVYQIRDRYCSKCGQKIKWLKTVSDIDTTDFQIPTNTFKKTGYYTKKKGGVNNDSNRISAICN